MNQPLFKTTLLVRTSWFTMGSSVDTINQIMIDRVTMNRSVGSDTDTPLEVYQGYTPVYLILSRASSLACKTGNILRIARVNGSSRRSPYQLLTDRRKEACVHHKHEAEMPPVFTSD
jgi:hypothetical protein